MRRTTPPSVKGDPDEGIEEAPTVSRHQSHRRRTYGRRQHEVHERRGRDAGQLFVDADSDTPGDDGGLFGRSAPLYSLFSARSGLAEGRV